MENGEALARVFVAALPPGTGAPTDDLAGALVALHEAGRAAWPGVALEASAFARHLAGHAAPEATLPPLALAPDVYLACACAAGSPAAFAAFERHFADVLARAIGRVDGSAAFVEDTRQAVLQRLLTAPEGAPRKIAEYAGRAPLRAWLRAVAVRTALNLRRAMADQPHETIDDGCEALGAGLDPEVGYLKAHYKVEFEAAVRAAVAKLSPEDRTLLRLHLADGLSIDVLAAHYQVGRSTAARRLSSARDSLRDRTRAELTARLRVNPAELASLMGLIRSQLDLSAMTLLRDVDAGG